MSGAIATTALIAGGIGAAGGIGGALISSNAANNAANTQAQAADNSAQLQYLASQNALDFTKQQWAQNQQNLAPWLQSGRGALSNLNYLMGLGSPTAASGVAGTPSGSPALPTQPVAGTGINPRGIGNGSRINPQPLVSDNPMSHFGVMTAQNGTGPQGDPLAGLPGGNPTGFQFNNGTPRPTALTPGSNVRMVNGGAVNPSMGGETSFPSSAVPSGVNPTLGGFGSLMQPYGQTFQAPDGLTEQNDPGYQARLKLGTDALERSAAARGGVLTGGTAQAENQLAQDYASNEYNNVYNRALTGFTTNYNVDQQNKANQFNRLAALSGVGQTTAQQLGSLGASTANSVTGNLLNTAAGMGQAYQNAANANASGMVGSANAWSGALGGGASNISQLMLMQQLLGRGSSGGGGSVGDYLLESGYMG